MWGEIHKSTNMIALWHLDESSGLSHTDAMGNYDLTSGADVYTTDIIAKKNYSLALVPPNNNDLTDTYITKTDDAIPLADIEDIRTVGAWVFPGYSDSVYRSYEERIVEIAKGSTYDDPVLQLIKKGSWDGSNLEDTFEFKATIETNVSISSISTSQIYEYNKPYYLFLIFKPSDVDTHNGYIRLYVNFDLAASLDDPNSGDTRWEYINKDYNRKLHIGTEGQRVDESIHNNTTFRGKIDEVFISKDVFTEVQINNMNTDWKNSYIII